MRVHLDLESWAGRPSIQPSRWRRSSVRLRQLPPTDRHSHKQTLPSLPRKHQRLQQPQQQHLQHLQEQGQTKGSPGGRGRSLSKQEPPLQARTRTMLMIRKST